MERTITWDEVKREINLLHHHLDFADLDDGFFLTAVIIPAKKGRRMAIGYFEAEPIAVVFTHLGTEAVSVVPCARPAGRKGGSYD